MARRRFGVSLPEDLAGMLDELAEKMGVDRSTIVSEAVREYVHDRLHRREPHSCEGVLLVVYTSRNAPQIAGALEEYSDIIVARTHIHASRDTCIEIAYLRGDSPRIMELERRLRERGAELSRYVANPR